MTIEVVEVVEREMSERRHLAIRLGHHGMIPLCRPGASLREPWRPVQPDPASAKPICAQCLRAADRVADLADRQEGIE